MGGSIQPITQDVIAILQKQPVMIQGNAGAASLAGKGAFDMVGTAVPIPVLQQDQAGRDMAILPVGRAIGIEGAVGPSHNVTDMPKLVRENLGTEAGRQRQSVGGTDAARIGLTGGR
jgi:hypothetical protein